jgi:hypothetical protein
LRSKYWRSAALSVAAIRRAPKRSGSSKISIDHSRIGDDDLLCTQYFRLNAVPDTTHSSVSAHAHSSSGLRVRGLKCEKFTCTEGLHPLWTQAGRAPATLLVPTPQITSRAQSPNIENLLLVIGILLSRRQFCRSFKTTARVAASKEKVLRPTNAQGIEPCLTSPTSLSPHCSPKRYQKNITKCKTMSCKCTDAPRPQGGANAQRSLCNPSRQS